MKAVVVATVAVDSTDRAAVVEVKIGVDVIVAAAVETVVLAGNGNDPDSMVL